MNAIITMNINEPLPAELIKISKLIYWNEKTNTFYKSAVFPTLTMFKGDSLINRQNMVFTEFNPSFLAIRELFEKQVLPLDFAPRYLPK